MKAIIGRPYIHIIGIISVGKRTFSTFPQKLVPAFLHNAIEKMAVANHQNPPTQIKRGVFAASHPKGSCKAIF
jgi:hypothetical protein